MYITTKKILTGIATLALLASPAFADSSAAASVGVNTAAVVEGDSGTTFGGAAIGAAECAEAFVALGLGVSMTNRVCLLTKTTLGLYQAGLLSPQEARLNAIEIMRMQGIEYRPLNQAQQTDVSTRAAAPAPQQPAAPTPTTLAAYRVSTGSGTHVTIDTSAKHAAYTNCGQGLTVTRADGSQEVITHSSCNS